ASSRVRPGEVEGILNVDDGASGIGLGASKRGGGCDRSSGAGLGWCGICGSGALGNSRVGLGATTCGGVTGPGGGAISGVSFFIMPGSTLNLLLCAGGFGAAFGWLYIDPGR